MSGWFETKKEKPQDRSNEMMAAVIYVGVILLIGVFAAIFAAVPIFLGALFAIYWVQAKENVPFPKVTLLFTVLCASSVSLLILNGFYAFGLGGVYPFINLAKFIGLDHKPELIIQLHKIALGSFATLPALTLFTLSSLQEDRLRESIGVANFLQRIVDLAAWVPEKMGSYIKPKHRKVLFWLIVGCIPGHVRRLVETRRASGGLVI